jgi:hypothetical protein
MINDALGGNARGECSGRAGARTLRGRARQPRPRFGELGGGGLDERAEAALDERDDLRAAAALHRRRDRRLRGPLDRAAWALRLLLYTVSSMPVEPPPANGSRGNFPLAPRTVFYLRKDTGVGAQKRSPT